MNKILNMLVIAILSLIVVITLLFFVKISDKSHPYLEGTDIEDTYAPYFPWNRAKKH